MLRLLLWCAQAMGQSVGPKAVGLYQLSGWLAACWAATVTWQACRYLIGPRSGKRLVN